MADNVVLAPNKSSTVYAVAFYQKGDRGPAGPQGSEWLFGTGVPDNALGSDDQIYYNQSSGGIYKKIAGAWSLQFTITGQPTAPLELEYLATADGATSVPLPNVNAALGINVFINGVREPKNGYTFTATEATLPVGLDIVAGDVIHIEYYA